jgi:hypothetical protein
MTSIRLSSTAASSISPRWVLTLVTMLALLGPSLPTVGAVQSCNGATEEMLEFRFFTDAHSWSDNGWTLSCTDIDTGIERIIWDVPVGSIAQEDSTQIIRYADCIPRTYTCTFVLEDFGADGLYLEGENGLAGWYSLVYGSTTIDTYNGKELFTHKSYCIGTHCDQLPQEVATPSPGSCQHATMFMQLDGRPYDTSYSLVCTGPTDGVEVLMWNGTNFTTAGQQISEDTCLSNTVCCTFTVTDTNTEGMTDPYVDVTTGTEEYGSVYLEWNDEGIVEYDGVTGEEFDILSVQFGFGCAGTTQGPDGTTSTVTTAAPASTSSTGEEGMTDNAAIDDVDDNSGEEEEAATVGTSSPEVGGTASNGSTNSNAGTGSSSGNDEGSFVAPDDYGGEIPIVGSTHNQSTKDGASNSDGGGVSHAAMVALVTMATLAIVAGLVVAMFYTKTKQSMKVAVMSKDSELL